MNAVQEAKRFVGAGQFLDALKALDAGQIERPDRTESEVLRAELLERIGQHAISRERAEDLLRSRKLTAGERSACNLILARADTVDGRFDSAIAHLQRAVSVAQTSGDYERACWAQLRLLVLLSEHSGPDAVVPLLAELRTNATRTGNPVIVAALHVFVAQVEAKRSLISSARRHLRIALGILQRSPNAWLEAMAKQIETAIAIMRAEFQLALKHASAGVELAERSGAAHVCATSHGNLSNVLFLTGDYNNAVRHQERAFQGFPPRSDSRIATLDSLVRIRLAQKRLDDCDDLLGQIDDLLGVSENRTRYVYRHALLTRVNAWSRSGRVQDALAEVDTAIHLAETSGDGLLFHVATLTKAELLANTARVVEAIRVIEHVSLTVGLQPPDVYALYERVLACALWKENNKTAASSHIARAKRIYEALHHSPGLVDLESSWARATEADPPLGEQRDDAIFPDRSSANSAIHSLTALVIHGGRLEFVARELIELLWTTRSVTSAKVVIRRAEGVEEILASVPRVSDSTANDDEHRISIGSMQDGMIEVVATLRPDVESGATFNSLKQLMHSLQEIERARVECEERATLWPLEDLPIDDERSVISGRMRELMNYARRIAKTKVNVLITGESGTGKEILARAIHDFSDRAQKAFVPFNCTTIPRDLLESQLFGHRRGAFTGADRDHLGLIRTAREGTLFLDEIGELGIDLQPKLLRFLESGEISPLGELGSLTIDVRIVAATNTNLEDAVRTGKFREDLFYRLNVVRLSIPPLRERRDEIPGFVNHFVSRAAEEFKKGHLRVAEETMERLLLYRWPGNVRQLQNEIRRMVALAEPDSTLLPHAISEDILGALPIFRHAPVNGREIAVDLHDKLMPTIARIECEMIKVALRTHHGKVEAVAKSLGISRKGLYLKRQRFGL